MCYNKKGIYNFDRGRGIVNYIVHFDICALLLCTVLLVTFYIKKNVISFKSRIFEVLMLTGGLATLADIGTILINNREGLMTAKWIVNMLYYLFHSATSFLVVSYFVVMAEPIVRMTFKRKCQLVVPFSFMAVMIAFNPLLKLLFYFDSNGVYHRGKYIWIGYVVAFYYLVFLMVFVLKHTDFFGRSMRVVIYVTSVLTLVPSVIQLYNPRYLVECFGAILYITIISMLYQANDASVDSVTKLLSRQSFESDCKAYTSTGMNFSVLIVKLNDAKFLSDMFGGQIASKVNKAFANYISKYVRYGNSFSFGGGAFALCFVNESSEPKFVMDSISQRMKEPWGFEEMKTILSASLCLISYPQHAPDYTTFLELVDEIVASDDKNTITYVDSIEIMDRRRKATIERTLKSDNISRALEVVYQPIYSEKLKSYTNAEAFVRLRDPILGYVMPDEFIPIAEKTGTMFKVGEYVFENVCKLIASGKLDDAGIKLIGVNLSVPQCMQTDLISLIASIVQKYDVNPSKICFEITEHVGANPPDIVVSNIKELYALGFKFAIDDFGTGSASFQQLMVLPISYLKLDRSFIEEALQNDKTMILLNNSINIAKSIRLEVVAEGIESKEVAMQVKEHFKVDFCQGYYYAQSCKGLELPFAVKTLNSAENVLDKQ